MKEWHRWSPGPAKRRRCTETDFESEPHPTRANVPLWNTYPVQLWYNMAVAKHPPRTVAGNIVGSRVRQARQMHDPPLSQDALSGKLAARGVAIGRVGISKIELGRRSVLDYEVLALCQALRVQVVWLLNGR